MIEEIKKRAYSWALTPYDSSEKAIDMGYSSVQRQCGIEILTILGEKIPEPCQDESYCENKNPHESKDCIYPVLE